MFPGQSLALRLLLAATAGVAADQATGLRVLRAPLSGEASPTASVTVTFAASARLRR